MQCSSIYVTDDIKWHQFLLLIKVLHYCLNDLELFRIWDEIFPVIVLLFIFFFPYLILCHHSWLEGLFLFHFRSPGFGLTLVAESTTGVFYSAEAVSNPAGEEFIVPEDIAKQASYSLLEEIYRVTNNKKIVLILNPFLS